MAFKILLRKGALHGNIEALALLLGLTERAIQKLTKDKVLHKGADGDFNLTKAIREYYMFHPASKEEVDYAKEKAKHEHVKRQLSELELAKRRHEVHAAEDVELVMGDMLSNIRTRVLGISNLAPQLTGLPQEEIADRLSSEGQTILLELSDYNPTMFDIEPEEADDNETEND